MTMVCDNDQTPRGWPWRWVCEWSRDCTQARNVPPTASTLWRKAKERVRIDAVIGVARMPVIVAVVRSVPVITNQVIGEQAGPFLFTNILHVGEYPATWLTNLPIRTGLVFEQNDGYAGAVLDDYAWLNGTLRIPSTGPTLLTSNAVEVTGTWMVGTNTLAVWDRGNCGGSNNAVYAADHRPTQTQAAPPVTVTITNENLCAGFDDWTGTHVEKDGRVWVSVPQGGSNTVTVNISPANMAANIIFVSADASIAIVWPTNLTGATQTLTINGMSSIPDITNTMIHVQLGNTATLTSFHVDVLPVRSNVTVALYYVTATGNTNTVPTNVATSAELETKLNTVFGSQANVFFTVWPAVSTNVNYDLNGNSKLNIAGKGCEADTEEYAAIAEELTTTANLRVFYVRGMGNDSGVEAGGWTPALAGIPLNRTFIQDEHNGSPAYIAVHEVGHSLGHLKDLTNAAQGKIDRLMWGNAQTNDPCRLIRDEWRKLNKRAEVVLP